MTSINSPSRRSWTTRVKRDSYIYQDTCLWSESAERMSDDSSVEGDNWAGI